MSDYFEPKTYKTVPIYKITVDLRALPFAEETMFECEDGVTRAGIFIPYEENNIYRYNTMSVLHILALANNGKRKRSIKNEVNQTHSLQPWWTNAHSEKMEELGFVKKHIHIGWMSVLQWCSWRTT